MEDHEHLFPGNREFVAPGLSATIMGTNACGAVANLSADYIAKIVVLIEVKYLAVTELSSHRSYGSHSASQPPCPPAPCPEKAVSASAAPQQSVASTSDGSTTCYEDRDERQDPGTGGGGGDCKECVDEPPQPTYCRVRYSYWKDTGEIFSWTVLWCA